MTDTLSSSTTVTPSSSDTTPAAAAAATVIPSTSVGVASSIGSETKNPTTVASSTASAAAVASGSGSRAQDVYRAYLADLYTRAALPINNGVTTDTSSSSSVSSSAVTSRPVIPSVASSASSSSSLSVMDAATATARAKRISDTLEAAHYQLMKLLSRSMDDDLRPVQQGQHDAFCAKMRTLSSDEKSDHIKRIQQQLYAIEGDQTKTMSAIYPRMLSQQKRETKAELATVTVPTAPGKKPNTRPLISLMEFMVREDVLAGRAWKIRRALSPTECKEIIDITEQQQYDLAETYCHEYRGRKNDRLVCDDEALSSLIFKRTRDFLPPQVTHTDGSVWNISSLNFRWRFCKYEAGHYFGAHVDGYYQPNKDERSFITLMIYLNNAKGKDFSGGSTVFLDSDFKPIKECIPEAGLILCFYQDAPHELLHEGAPLVAGTKYMMRSDVMYRREA